MQALASRVRARSKNTGIEPKAAECAGTVLETVPSVMWFVRRQLRSRRAKGLSVPQFRVLLLAENGKCLAVSEISANLGVSVPTASRIATGLVEKGFLDRGETAGDRRCRPIRLSPAGQAALRQAWAGVHDAMTVALASLSAAECKQIAETMRLLGKLIAAASED